MPTMLVEPLAPWLRDLNRFVAAGAAAPFTPPADVLVTDAEVRIEMDVPGVSAENLEIELENDVLTIRGERPSPYGEQDQGAPAARRIERPFGPFERTLRVPRGLDPNTIEAELHDGMLTLRIPRPEPPKPHRIQIRRDGAREGQSAAQQARGQGEQGAQGAAAEGERGSAKRS